MTLEPLKLCRQLLGLAGIQTIGHHQHQRSAPDQPARVTVTQNRNALAQSRASSKVVYGNAGGLQHGVGVGQAEGSGQIGQARAESKNVSTHLHAMGLPRGRVQKRQHQAGIALHGA